MKNTTPEFSSEIFDTFAKIVSGRSAVYLGANETLRNTELPPSKRVDLEIKLIKMIASKLGDKELTTTQSQVILKKINELQIKITHNLKNNLELITTEFNQSTPPMTQIILFFLVCACSDIELNNIKKKLRQRLRETKRHKSGKAADTFFESIFDLQSLSVTGHWHQQTLESPIPSKVIEFVSTYNQFKFMVNQTMNSFSKNGFPDRQIFADLNKGRDVYFTWAVQSLVKIAGVSSIQEPSEEISNLLKKLISNKFSTRTHLKKSKYSNLKDPHQLYIQLQALLISTRLIPM